MENTRHSISQIKIRLQEIRLDIQHILKDPSFLHWEKVDLEKHQELLKSFGIEVKEVLHTQLKLKREIAAPTKEISMLENNLGHLAIDVESGHIDEMEAQKQCKVLQQKTSENAEIVKVLQQKLTFLQDAATSVLKNLSIDKLIPMAQEITVGKKTKYFHNGLSYLSLMREKPDKESININHLLEKSAQVEAKFIRLQFPELPKLAETVLANHIDASLSTLTLIKQYLDKTGHSGNTNLKKIQDFQQYLTSHSTQPLNDILKAFPGLVEKTRDLVCALHSHSAILEQTAGVNQLVHHMDTLYVALRHDYFEHLTQQIQQDESPLSPHVTASKIAFSFFSGFKGIVRNLRIAFGSPEKSEERPDQHLRNLLIKTINTCPYYCGSEASDIAQITAFIDDLLANCSRPFPYTDFFRIIKKSIAIYGENVERDFYHYKIFSSAAQYREEKPQENSASESPQTTFGKLLGKIETLSKQLKNTVTQNNN